MESLRPDREDLDQFKNRNKKKVPPASKAAKVSSSVQSNNKAASPLFIFVLILALGCSAALSWYYFEQQNQLEELKLELKDTSDFIARSKLLMARFEGELNVTGVEIEQSGSKVQQKLAFLDGEMRKLWGVSNDRNKKSIQGNSEALASLVKKVEDLKSQQAKSIKRRQLEQSQLSLVMSGLTEELSVVRGSLNKQGGRISMLANESVITRDEQDESMVSLKQELAQIKVLSKRLDESNKSLASIDASRRQLIERVVGLERQVNKLQLNIKKTQKASDVQ